MNNRFRPPRLESHQAKEVRTHLQLSRIRRESFELGEGAVRLLVDGDEHLSFHPGDGVRKAFSVPANAGFIELHSDDEQGDIMLAVFMVPECFTFKDRFFNHVALRHTSGALIEIGISYLRPKPLGRSLLQLSCLSVS